MITAYAGDGSMVEARELFDVMAERNVVTWNAIIDGYVKGGHRDEAWRLFISLHCSAVKCNETTLTSLFCSHRRASSKSCRSMH